MSRWWVTAVLALAALGGGFLLGQRQQPPAKAPTAQKADSGPEQSAAEAGIVTLDAEKLAAAKLKVETASTRPLQVRHQIPGKLRYNDNRHVAIKVVTDGILTASFVQPGDRVRAGQPLATVSAPEVGQARADVLMREDAVGLARQKLDWAQQTAANIRKLAERIRDRKTYIDIEKEFEGQPLGEARDKLLGNYSSYLLQRKLNSSPKGLDQSEFVPERTLSEREGKLQLAAQTLDASIEQVGFQSQVDANTAAAALKDAERRYEIACRHLSTLLGTPTATVRESRKLIVDEKVKEPNESSTDDLTLMTLRAPFEGTIEKRMLAVTERVRQGDTVFVLADTSTLWVSADIRELDWNAVSLQKGADLEVFLPALPNRKLTARVEWVGREVEAETNSVPLVALVHNADGALRPGMFARVLFPQGEPRMVMALPDSALVEHEGQKFVFICESPEKYRRVDVVTGASDGSWIEIKSGLRGGEQVVTEGAFLLKSALLLEPEAEGGGA